jgi:chromosome segregation and condensation protein ScpB
MAKPVQLLLPERYGRPIEPSAAASHPAASYNYVTTAHFRSAFGMETLRDLLNIEAFEDVVAQPTSCSK